MGSNQLLKLLSVLAALVVIAYVSGAFDEAPSTIDVPEFDIQADQITSIEVITPQQR